MNLNSYIDHTILKATTSASEVDQLCAEAITHQFAAVCIPSYFIARAQEICKASSVKIATVAGFPFGYNNTTSKKAEISAAIRDGAAEIDMVANIAAIKDGNWNYLSKELSEVLQIIRLNNKSLKWIIESGDLTDAEIIRCCELSNLHQIDFLKTSTGYGNAGASLHAVRLMREHLKPGIRIKASGGIRDKATAISYVEAGASRIGTSSGVAIVS